MTVTMSAAAKPEDQIPEPTAQRAIDDPVKLARAARIVRLALARQRITLEDLAHPAQLAPDDVTARRPAPR